MNNNAVIMSSTSPEGKIFVAEFFMKLFMLVFHKTVNFGLFG